ncbi:DUF3040 domain-containing protein [Nonomuraea sp. NPDC048826]|uniref:DUF3040 domain-containing protein n=1 Tax=Nonomuraea sp. NPDC048826 TaxID=3364347 RepID=UPI003711D23F
MEAVVMDMALSEQERRILEEIEEALRRDDPELARRVSGYRARRRRPLLLRGWFIAVVVVLTLVLLVLAVALA